MEKEVNGEIRILCIEDNSNDYEIIKRFLEKKMKEINLERESVGLRGLTKMRKEKFDILLLDYRLPDINGLEVMEIMKKEGIDVPIIMLTGKGDEKVAVEAMKKGVGDYIVKDDLETEKLSESITQLIDLTKFIKKWDNVFKEIRGMSKRRSTTTILASMLSESIHGIGKTMLVHKTNLNFKSIKKYLAYLLNNDFLSVHYIKGKENFKTTKKGLLLLRQLREIEEYFE